MQSSTSIIYNIWNDIATFFAYGSRRSISYIKDFLGHSSIDSTAIYAHADNDAMAEALRSVDQEALPEKDEAGNTLSAPEKKWKGKEEYLLHFCGLG